MHAHLTAHARGHLLPLADDDVCRWLWEHLRDAFPQALAVILMPDHPHIILPFVEGLRRTLAAILGACARVFGLGEVWQPVPEPGLVATVDKLARGIRYTILNGCRPWKHRGRLVRLVSDPLEHRWSTLRDAMGAVADPWTPIESLAESLAWRPGDGVGRFHRYIVSDDHVDAAAARLPTRAPSSDTPRITLDAIAQAATEAARATAGAIRRRAPARRIFAALALDQGWRQPAAIAGMCGVHPNSVARLAASCPPAWLEAAALCLGDPRLLVEPALVRSTSL